MMMMGLVLHRCLIGLRYSDCKDQYVIYTISIVIQSFSDPNGDIVTLEETFTIRIIIFVLICSYPTFQSGQWQAIKHYDFFFNMSPIYSQTVSV